MHQEKVSGDVLVRKQAFLDNGNVDVRKLENWHFCKGVHDFVKKKLKFFHVLCLSNIHREKVFANVLNRKEALQEY